MRLALGFRAVGFLLTETVGWSAIAEGEKLVPFDRSLFPCMYVQYLPRTVSATIDAPSHTVFFCYPRFLNFRSQFSELRGNVSPHFVK